MYIIKRKTYPAELLCRICGCKRIIPRRNSEKKEIFQEITVYCMECKEDTIHLEAPFHKNREHFYLY